MLSGVSAGVIGLDERGRVDLPNRSACELLGTTIEDLHHKPFGKAVPEMAKLFSTVRRSPGRLAQGQIEIVRGGRRRTLLVRIGAERDSGGVCTTDIVSHWGGEKRCTVANVVGVPKAL